MGQILQILIVGCVYFVCAYNLGVTKIKGVVINMKTYETEVF